MNSDSETSESYNRSLFLSPRSIAIIGASEKPGIGRAIFANIKNGYKGKIYPVSPTNDMYLESRRTKVCLTYQRI